MVNTQEVAETESNVAFSRLNDFLKQNKKRPVKVSDLVTQLEGIMPEVDGALARGALGKGVVSNWKDLLDKLSKSEREYLQFEYGNWLAQPLILGVKFYAGKPGDCLSRDELDKFAEFKGGRELNNGLFKFFTHNKRKKSFSTHQSHIDKCDVCRGVVYDLTHQYDDAWF